MRYRGLATRRVFAGAFATVVTVQFVWLAGEGSAREHARSQRCERSVPTASHGLAPNAAWDSLPSGPADGRVFAGVVWTGSELMVWGGEAGGEQERRADGAAYDVQRQSWRRLPEVELAPRSEHVAVWTGEEMLIWGGVGARGLSTADAAAYAPDRRRWRRLPKAPLAATGFAVGVWTGTDMLVWGGSREGGVIGELEGTSYRPRTDRWRRIPSAPLSPRRGSTGVWTGCELVVWGGVPTSDRPTNDGAAYDPRTRRWHKLPVPPFLSDDEDLAQFAQHRPNLVWTGREVILWGYLDDLRLGSEQVAPAAAYDPSTKTWRLLPAAPLDFADEWEGLGGERAVWVPGVGMLVTTGNLDQRGTRTLALDLMTGVWSELRRPPDGPNYFGELFWTGDGVIAWGQAPNALILR